MAQLSDILTIDQKIIRSLVKVETYGKTIGFELLTALEAAQEQVVLLDTVTGETWTGRETATRVRSLASALVSDGVTKGQVVCLLTDDKNLGLTAIAIMSIWVVGAVYTTGGDLKYPIEEVLKVCERSKASCLVVSGPAIGVAQQVSDMLPEQIRKVYLMKQSSNSNSSIPLLFDLPPNDQVRLPVDVRPSDPGLIVTSNGTTGVPKAVMISQQALVAYQLMGIEPFAFGGRLGDRLMVPMPQYHVSDVSFLIVAVLRGSLAILYSHNMKILVAAANAKATSTFLVTSQANLFANEQFELEHELSDVVVGGSRLSRDAGQRLMSKYKLRSLRNLYGSTETSCSHLLPIFAQSDDFGCSGAPLPGVQYKVVDVSTGHRLGPNEFGEILVSTPQIFTEYMNDPDATREAFDKEGFYKTGDGGYYDHRGLLFFTDRLKEIIKVDGNQVSPAELEGILLSHDAVQLACVFAVPDPEVEEVAMAYVVKQPGYESVTESELMAFLEKQVNTYKHLYGGLEFLGDFPRTAIGKIDRLTLKRKALAELKLVG